jgi:transposase
VVRRTWARRGVTPVIGLSPARRRLSAISALCLDPAGTIREHFQLERKGIGADDLFWFLIQLRKHYQRRLIVVWDRWSVHAKVARWFGELDVGWIEFEPLPAYAPELNPVEWTWSQTKYHDLANYVPPADTGIWIARIRKSRMRINRRKSLLKSFFAAAGLEIDDLI